METHSFIQFIFAGAAVCMVSILTIILAVLLQDLIKPRKKRLAELETKLEAWEDTLIKFENTIKENGIEDSTMLQYMQIKEEILLLRKKLG